MLTLKKFWATCKHYWWIILFPLGTFIIAYIVRTKGLNGITDLLENTRKRHKTELDKINDEHDKELKARDEALKKMQETLALIEQQYKDAQQKLDAQKKKEIEQLIKQGTDNPQVLAEKLSEVTGFKIILPPSD